MKRTFTVYENKLLTTTWSVNTRFVPLDTLLMLDAGDEKLGIGVLPPPKLALRSDIGGVFTDPGGVPESEKFI